MKIIYHEISVDNAEISWYQDISGKRYPQFGHTNSGCHVAPFLDHDFTLGIVDFSDIYNHPRLGASWEGFAFEQTVMELGLKESDVYFWGVHTGAELDLVFKKRGQLWGVEFKFTGTPKITPSVCSAISELNLNHIWIVHPGEDTYPLGEAITVVGINKLKSSFELVRMNDY